MVFALQTQSEVRQMHVVGKGGYEWILVVRSTQISVVSSVKVIRLHGSPEYQPIPL